MSHGAVALERCPNCGRRLDGPFCANCGQRAAGLNPTLHDFLHDLTHELLHVDGKIFRSVRLLLTAPGFLTREYFDGRRASYISPIRLYLIFSLAYFTVAAIAPTAAVDPTATAANREELQLGVDERELEGAVTAALSTWAPRVMFVLVPLFALLVKLVMRRSGRNYPLHMYFALHVHAAGFALLALATLPRFARPPGWTMEVVQLAALACVAIHCVLAFQRAYGGSLTRALLRASVVGLLYVFAVLFTLIAVVVPVVLPMVRGTTS